MPFVGLANAGKSSLVNALLNADHSIVSDVPGTTRDRRDARLDADGVTLVLEDGPGFRRETGEGVADDAICVCWIVDGARAPDDEWREWLAVAPAPALVVLNKSDLPPGLTETGIRDAVERLGRPTVPVLAASARTGVGLAELRAALRYLGLSADEPVVAGEEESRAVRASVLAGERALLVRDAPELAAEELRFAREALDSFADGGEALLERIFSRFCIGK